MARCELRDVSQMYEKAKRPRKGPFAFLAEGVGCARRLSEPRPAHATRAPGQPSAVQLRSRRICRTSGSSTNPLQKRKRPQQGRLHFSGGEGGIRTHGTVKPYTGFRIRRIRPLCHLSKIRHRGAWRPHPAHMLVSSVRLALRASRSGPASLSKIAPGDFVDHSATSPKFRHREGVAAQPAHVLVSS